MNYQKETVKNGKNILGGILLFTTLGFLRNNHQH